MTKTNIPVALKKNLNKEEMTAMEDTGMQIWYYCDECQKGIQPLGMRFECMECDDYVLCKSCKENVEHAHRFKKQIVPENCPPPSDAQIQEILNEFKYC